MALTSDLASPPAPAGSIAARTLAGELQRCEQRFSAIVETSLQGKLVHRGFQPLFANRAFRAMFQIEGDQALFSRDALLKLFDEETRANPEAAWQRLLGLGQSAGRRTMYRRDGAPFRAEIFARVLDWDDGPACVMAVLDVSREERAARELKDAQILAEAAARAKTRFLSAASHELRTPLHAAMGRLQLLLTHELGPREANLAEESLLGCRRLLHHIDDVLDAAALESGALPLAPEPIDLARSVRALLATVRLDADELGLEIEADVFPGGPGRLVGDERRVRRIALALLEEAIRRRPPHKIRLEVHAEARGLTLSVSAPGAHLQPTLCTPPDGAVEGMAIARALAAAMGGVLIERTSSKSAWEASAFLPLPWAEPISQPLEASDQARDVLVVEDNSGNRQLIKLVLEALGHRCHIAPDGVHAISAVASRPFDLVLMDLHMPGMDGFEAARRIRALPAPWARLPIAALTASCAPGVQEAAAEAGMDAFLQKPIDVTRLAEAILLLTAHRSVDPAELDQVEQDDGGDEAENDEQRGHGMALAT